MVVPSMEEFGITAVEAQASGRPVIAAGAGGALETVLDGRTGLLASLDDPDSSPRRCAGLTPSTSTLRLLARMPSVSPSQPSENDWISRSRGSPANGYPPEFKRGYERLAGWEFTGPQLSACRVRWCR